MSAPRAVNPALAGNDAGRVGLLYQQLTTKGVLLFFFQAEDGIRDLTVTGVQTCALPISIMHLWKCFLSQKGGKIFSYTLITLITAITVMKMFAWFTFCAS